MENRSNNCKTQSNNRASAASRSTNAAVNEHKHPNQYTKGADDESAKNAKTTDSKSAKNCKSGR